jgi:hypothetical protein
MPRPTDHAAHRRDQRLARTRRVSLWVAGGAAAGSLGLGVTARAPGRVRQAAAPLRLPRRRGRRVRADGRGGAGFPTGMKLRAVAAGRGPAVVVANGMEGAVLAAEAVRAEVVHVCLPRATPRPAGGLTRPSDRGVRRRPTLARWSATCSRKARPGPTSPPCSSPATAAPGVLAGRGACRHPDGAVRPASSAETAFAADVHAHVPHGPCRAARRGRAGDGLLPIPALLPLARRAVRSCPTLALRLLETSGPTSHRRAHRR